MSNTNPHSFVSITSRPPNLFQWVAEYDSGKILTQYGGPNRQFKDLTEFSNQDTLEKLYLVRLIPDREDEFSPDMRPCFMVDLKTGHFSINGEMHTPIVPDLPIGFNWKDAKYRPIYHRRIRGGVGISGGKGYASLVKYYWLGWQATIDGKNYQRIIQYDVPNDSWLFKEKR